MGAAHAGWAALVERADRFARRAQHRWAEQAAAAVQARQANRGVRRSGQRRQPADPGHRPGAARRRPNLRPVDPHGVRPLDPTRAHTDPNLRPVDPTQEHTDPGLRHLDASLRHTDPGVPHLDRPVLRQVGGQPEQVAPRHLAADASVRRASWREDVMTGWCSLLLVLGLYLDGWNHINLLDDGLGPFLTPWHGVLYAGFTVTAVWILSRNQRRGAWSLAAVPPGYRLALVGIALAMVALAGDAVWHTLYGEEQGLARLISPFHLVLFTGASLLVSSSLRAAWSGPTSARVPGLRAFWPVVLSTTLVVAMAAFFFQYVSPVVAWRRPALAVLPATSPFAETVQVYELLGLLVHNLLFIAPVLLLLLRWQTPLGTFTVMAGSVALLLSTQTELGLVGLVGAAVLGGAAADLAVAALRPSPQRPWAARSVALIAPAVYWTAHFALLRAGYGVSWELEIWLGSVVWASLSGLTLALLMWPPAVPLTAWNRGRNTPRPVAAPAPMPARMVGR
jgi:hypothetical protein